MRVCYFGQRGSRGEVHIYGQRGIHLEALYPQNMGIPGGLFLSLIQCVFENTTYDTISQLTLIDSSSIRFSCFLKSGETFYQKYKFKYPENVENYLKKLQEDIQVFRTIWLSKRKEFCARQYTKDFWTKIDSCNNYDTFDEYLSKMERLNGGVITDGDFDDIIGAILSLLESSKSGKYQEVIGGQMKYKKITN